MAAISQPLATAAAISAFVVAMMALVEALHIYSKGTWMEALIRRPGAQYLLAAFLGATPGCLGVFSLVALFIHGRLSMGAMVAAGVASCGDEAFVMLAVFPAKALWIFVALAVYGLVVGILTGWMLGDKGSEHGADCLTIHTAEPSPIPGLREILRQWRRCTLLRGSLSAALLLVSIVAVVQATRTSDDRWLPLMLAFVAGGALLAVVVLPDHFVEAHLWRHVIRKHSWRIFLWTAAALLVMDLGRLWFANDAVSSLNPWAMLAIACLVGLLPESGPHVVFVVLYAQGAIPLGVLLGSSVVQDGHGMLPLLAHSRKDFITVKATNFAAGFALGSILLAANL